MVVPKKIGKCQVGIDYTNLNDACSNDSFMLPRIDQIVDATAEHGMLSFIDAFSKYHQIPMFQPDEKKTAFVMPHGLYCYKFYMYLVMSNCAVGAVMFHHIRDKKQRLIYYLSKAMVNAETRELLKQAIQLGFSISNNEAKYEAILAGLDIALTLAVVKLKIYSDSQLVIGQIQEEYEVDALDKIVATLLIKEVILLSIYFQVTSSIAPASNVVLLSRTLIGCTKL
ncbi:hypothetical protein AAG906_012837 [Vitis piasezkii]